MNRSEIFFNQLADVREACAAAQHYGLFEFDHSVDGVKELQNINSIIDVLDTSYDTEKESQILSRIRRECVNDDWSPEECFESFGLDANSTNFDEPAGHLGEILNAQAKGEIAEDDLEDEQGFFILHAMTALFCATSNLQAFKPQVTVTP